MEFPLNSRIILKKSSANSTLRLSTDLELETDFYLIEVILSEASSPIKPGYLVCVPRTRVGEIPFKNQLEYICYVTDVLYYITSGERDSFS